MNFAVQKHYASHLHYDFQLEMEGLLRRWALPKGTPTEVGIKRLKVKNSRKICFISHQHVFFPLVK